MPRSVEEVCAIVKAKATSEERATLLHAAAGLKGNAWVALDPAFATEDDVIKFLRAESAGGAGAGVVTTAVCTFLMKRERERNFRKVPCLPTLSGLAAAAESVWPTLKLRNFKLVHNGLELTEASPIPEANSKIVVKLTGKSFSKYKVTGEALQELAKTMLGVDMSGGVPIEDDQAFKELKFNMEKKYFEGNKSANDLLIQVADTLLMCLSAMPPLSDQSEISQRGFIMPLLALAVSMARVHLQGMDSRPADWGTPVLRPEHVLVGSEAWGPVDFIVWYRALALIIAEAKRLSLTDGWAQLIMQIFAVYERMISSLTGTLKKRNAFEAHQLDSVPLYAILCTAGRYRLVRYTPGNNASLVTSNDILVSLSPRTPVSQVVESLARLVRMLAWVVTEAVVVIDAAKEMHAELSIETPAVGLPSTSAEALIDDDDEEEDEE